MTLVAAPMTEADLRRRVMGLATSLGLLWHYCRDGRKCDGVRGLPDLVIAGEHGLLLAELKDDGNETSPSQDRWIWILNQAGVQWRVWRPRDWHSGAIRRELEAIA